MGKHALILVNLPDFSNWQHPAAFARAFARSHKTLRLHTSRLS